MVNNPIPIILVLAVISRRRGLSAPALGGFGGPGSLELEAFLDNARTCINTIDRLNGIAHSGPAVLSSLGNVAALTGGGSGTGGGNTGGSGGLPDMKKIMEIVENLPL